MFNTMYALFVYFNWQLNHEKNSGHFNRIRFILDQFSLPKNNKSEPDPSQLPLKRVLNGDMSRMQQ